MVLEVEKYMPFMEGLDLTNEQKEELIRTLWTFTESMVDKAFGLHPVQQCRGYTNNDNLQARPMIVDSKASSLTNMFDGKSRHSKK